MTQARVRVGLRSMAVATTTVAPTTTTTLAPNPVFAALVRPGVQVMAHLDFVGQLIQSHLSSAPLQTTIARLEAARAQVTVVLNATGAAHGCQTTSASAVLPSRSPRG